MAYFCDKFKIEELVYPELFNRYKNRPKYLWAALDNRILYSADLIRKFLGIPVTINNWLFGGNFTESGLRRMDTTTGALLSQHKFGRALDLKFNKNGWTPETLRLYMQDIGCFDAGFLDRTDEIAQPFLYITRIEWMDNMNWFHMDVSNLGSNDGSIKIIRL